MSLKSCIRTLKVCRALDWLNVVLWAIGGLVLAIRAATYKTPLVFIIPAAVDITLAVWLAKILIRSPIADEIAKMEANQ
jgi:hypothetical protein